MWDLSCHRLLRCNRDLEDKVSDLLSIDHKLKSGTNTKKALQAVYSMMSWAEAPPEGWNRTRHVIIIMTDGESFLPPQHPPMCLCLQPECVFLDPLS